MKIFNPDEYEVASFNTGRHDTKRVKIDIGNLVCSDVLDEVNEAYTHNRKYVEEALDLITWPELEYLKDNTSMYIVALPALDHYNASATHNWHDKRGYIFLYGRTTPIPRHMTHYIVVHELGHIVQGIYCSENEDQEAYMKLRGVKDEWERGWTNSWRELFAEDFRWLFSIESAHQNTWSMNYPPPDEEVTHFMLKLVDKRNEREDNK